jgi:hypothetical protein
MKTSKLKNIAWVFFALVLLSISVLAQGRGNGNRYNQSQNENCLATISDLTEKQQLQIQEMENKHHEEMAVLRTKRQSTTNAIEKSEIRTEMLKKVEAHRNKVKEILTADQQKQYEQLHAYGNYGMSKHSVGRGQQKNTSWNRKNERCSGISIQDSSAVHGSRGISDEGFEVIE